MAELHVARRPALERPVLVAAFRGWNDGGQGASLAAGYLAKAWDARRFAEIDPEGFFDFQTTRPQVRLEEGLTRRIDWPETVFYHARPEGLGRDAVLLLGIEPNLRWRTFSGLIVDFAKELGVELMVTLGALLADVPHTRDAPVTGSATDQGLIEQLGLQASRYEGPTGIVGVVHDACKRANIPSASLWAAVPHYVSLAPSPKAAAALCSRLGRPARRRHRHHRARRGGGGLRPPGQRGDRDRRGDGRLRRGARAARRRDRRVRHPLGRVAGGGALPLPAGARRAGRRAGRNRAVELPRETGPTRPG